MMNLIRYGVLSIILFMISGTMFADVLITEYGAVGDGKKINTSAIQNAINDCSGNGGGVVEVPAGVFLTGSIELKSNITLYLSQGAVISGSTDLRHYPYIGFMHNELGETKSLIWALNQSNISITGEGEINFNGKAFMDYNTFNSNTSIEKSLSYNAEQKKEAVVKYLARPNQPIFFHNCKNLVIKGIKIKDAPCWTITTSECENVKILSVNINNDPQISNSDGIHISASRDVIVDDCIINAGDDCVAVTCITAWDKVSENIIITNSIFSSRSACIRLGHMSSTVRNVIASNILMYDSNRGIAIFSGEGGTVEYVTMNNIIMNTRKFAGGWWGKGEPLVAVSNKNGRIWHVSISDIKASVENSIVLYGEGINNFSLADWDITLSHGTNINHFKPLYELSPEPFVDSPDPLKHIPWIFAKNIKALDIKNIMARNQTGVSKFSITPYFEGVENLKTNNITNE